MMAGEQVRQCQLCGYRFDGASLACHTTCPMSSGCHIVCCPNCGYQVPDEDQMGVTGALKRAWENRRGRRKGVQA